MSSKEKHIEIAKKHKHFISFACLAVRNYPNQCKPEIFCVWAVVASYYRAIHLIEAVFDKHGQNHAVHADESSEDNKRNAWLGKLGLSALREEHKELRRFALHAKYFPNDSGLDYDVITQLDQTRKWIVEGYLANIERLVAAELGILPKELE